MKVDSSNTQEIIAAIKFDHQSERVAASAFALARRASKPLRLVHIFQTDAQSEVMGDGVNVLEKRLEHAEVYLSRLAARTCFGAEMGQVRTSVLVGTYPDALLEIAASGQGTLLVAGASKREPGIFSVRLRDTFRVMSAAELPVLIIPDAGPSLAAGNDVPLRVLLADDLTDSSWYAIRNLTHLIQKFHLVVDVMHVHVEPVNTAGMTLSPEYELEIWPGILIKDRLLNDRHDYIKTRMRNRSRNLKRAILEAGGSYHLELWHGNVSEELKRAVEVHGAEISVFGKHHFMHSRPFALGQMRYKNMIGLPSAILVSPENIQGMHA